MKKTICGVEYDTDTADIIAKHTSGNVGDEDGFEETLYKTPDGKLFLYVNGGEASIHPGENITRISAAKAEETSKDAAAQIISRAESTRFFISYLSFRKTIEFFRIVPQQT